MSQEPKDHTEICLSTGKVEEREMRLDELRHYFCRRCKRVECPHSKGLEQRTWEERIAAQPDELLHNPNIAALDSQDMIRRSIALDFKDNLQKALKLVIGEEKGDWSPVTQEDVANFLSGRELTSPQGLILPPSAEPEAEPQPEPEPQSVIIDVPSQSQRGVVYQVEVSAEGKAEACTCAGWKHRRTCTHLRWAEEAFKKMQKMQEPPPEPVPEVPWRMSREDRLRARAAENRKQQEAEVSTETPRFGQRVRPLAGHRAWVNTSSPPDGLYVPESEATLPKSGTPSPAKPWPTREQPRPSTAALQKPDKWEVPKAKVVQPGATITLGGSSGKRDGER